MAKTYEQETQVDIEINEICYDVTFNRVSKFSKENYEADADGNRGEMRTYLDEDYPEGIEVDGVPIKQLLPELQEKIEAELDKWLNDNYPEYDSED